MIDHEFVTSLVDIIDSPYIQIDPAARLVYMCLLFHGHILCQYKSPTTARQLYLRCLEVVPQWQSQDSGTVMDLIGASLLVSMK